MQKTTKLIIDVTMIVAILFSMSFHLLGVGVHKMIGLLTFLLFIVHNLLNRQWFKGLAKSKYTPVRIALTITNIAVILAMIGVAVSGVLLSKEMSQGFDGMTTGRILHNVSSYAGCIGIAAHIGFHLKRRNSNDD